MKKFKSIIQDQIAIYIWLLKLCFSIDKWGSTLFVVNSILQTAAGIFGYYSTARVTVELIRFSQNSVEDSVVWLWFMLTILSALVANFCYRVNHILDRRVYFALSKWASIRYAEQLATIDIENFYNSETKNTITRLTNGVTWQLANAAYFSLAVFLSLINTTATTITIVFAVWWLLPVFILLLIPMLVYESKAGAIGWMVFKHEGDSQTIFWGIMSTFTEVKKQFEIRAIGAAKKLHAKLTTLTDRYHFQQLQELRKLYKWNALAVFSQFARELLAQGWLITQVLSKKMSVDSYLFYVSLVFRLDGAISGLFSTFAQFNEAARFSKEYKEFIEIKPKLVDKDSAIELEKTPPTIEFRNVSFQYAQSKELLFKDLNFTIRAGEKVAFVGENGAGKSTIIKLLLRFYLPTSGDIYINGVNIVDIRISSLHEQLSVLFQEFNQYTLSALENIAISDTTPSEARAISAAKLSGAHSFLSKLPSGYQTNLNPSLKNGVDLSGGQWQKVALARAFYRDTTLLILDEPTSAIDAKAEAEVFNNIFTMHDGHTAIIVSHRFSTVRKADRIIVLDDGQIIESGTHAQLVKKNGVYKEMFNVQAEGYR